ncbi:MAG: pilus assembly protein PilM [bacterium]|nr:pilus assembly protein PilM [bacterium]
MALFSLSETYLGVDFGTSTSKIVELRDRRKGIDLITYAEANLQNLLVSPPNGNQDAVDRTAEALKQMLERAGVVSKGAVAALPGGAVFSTVLTLPNIPESEMENAVRFAARDIIPADIDEMVLGWSRVGREAHMTTDIIFDKSLEKPAETKKIELGMDGKSEDIVSVFITAAPKDIVSRYIAVFEKLQITLLSLEVETFSLARSLMSAGAKPTLLVDCGVRTTTYHIIDDGIPRVSHTLDFGGFDITKNMAELSGISEKEAEKLKNSLGISDKQSQKVRSNIENLLARQMEKAEDLVRLYEQKSSSKIVKSILIGGGANLPGFSEYWSKKFKMETSVGDPWKGLSYPATIGTVLQKNGPRFGVAVGLALRGFTHVM